jgi:hypothetical protein
VTALSDFISFLSMSYNYFLLDPLSSIADIILLPLLSIPVILGTYWISNI